MPFSNTNMPVHNDKCNNHVWEEDVAMEMSAAKLRRLIIIISEKQNSQTGVFWKKTVFGQDLQSRERGSETNSQYNRSRLRDGRNNKAH